MLLSPSSLSLLPFICCCCCCCHLSVWPRHCHHCLSAWSHPWLGGPIIICLLHHHLSAWPHPHRQHGSTAALAGWVASSSSSVFFVVVCLHGFIIVIVISLVGCMAPSLSHGCCHCLHHGRCCCCHCQCLRHGDVIIFAMVVMSPSSYGCCVVCRRAREGGKGGWWSWLCACGRVSMGDKRGWWWW